MSRKNKDQQRARQIQKDTGWSYSECLRLAREGITDAGLDALKKVRASVKETAKKTEEKKEPSEGARRAALRSPNYESMSARDQWEEDKQLGILDWDGD